MIAFLQPWALAGLAAAAIPLLLHLLARRDPPTQVFPAVRYLVEAVQEQSQRRRLQHWLLLLVRTLLIAALVLAAAGPSMALRGAPGHAPAALVLVVDNSASSGAVAEGTPRLAALAAAARGVLDRATVDDALWLLPADGIPRRGTPAELRRLLDSLTPAPVRLDLGEAIAQADEILAGERRPGEIVVLSDLQATSVSAASPRAALTVAGPDGPVPANLGIGDVQSGAQPWSPDGGRVSVTPVGDSGRGTQVQVRLDARAPRQGFAQAGVPTSFAVPGAAPGWHVLTLELGADELRADDTLRLGIRIAPPAAADCARGGRFVQAACDVLVQNGRLQRGVGVTVGVLGAGPSVVEPPADPAQLGAVNRALAARGIGWQFGTPAPAGVVDSGGPGEGARVQRRLALVPSGSGRTGVLARVGGTPWLAAQDGVILVGSRLEPEWTDLPVSAAFLPVLDGLLNRTVRGALAPIVAPAGAPVPLPDRVTQVVDAVGRRWSIEGGASFRAPAPGLYHLIADGDTVGTLSARVDPRESALAPAAPDRLRALWPGATVVPLDDAPSAAFSAVTRADLRGPLLWLALVLGLIEVLLASARRRVGD